MTNVFSIRIEGCEEGAAIPENLRLAYKTLITILH